MHVAASPGRVVAGRYLLQHPIGRGAMGTVWRARDSILARDVAVKEVRLRGPATSSARAEDTQVLYARTLREARTAARLNHPAVVTVFDVIEADGSPWIVMELIQARSLEQVLAEDGPLRPSQAADLGARLLSALSCAHAAGILHRDVKPSNVLLASDRRAVLTDFGIATLEGDPGLTQAGMVMGTPGFTAPERVRGGPASPASDLWSLGATLFAAVEGHGPFDDRGTSMAILAAIANEDAPRPRQAGPLRPAIEALLRRDPRERPDAEGAAQLLAAVGGGLGLGGGRAAEAGRWPSRPAVAEPARGPTSIPEWLPHAPEGAGPLWPALARTDPLPTSLDAGDPAEPRLLARGEAAGWAVTAPPAAARPGLAGLSGPAGGHRAGSAPRRRGLPDAAAGLAGLVAGLGLGRLVARLNSGLSRDGRRLLAGGRRVLLPGLAAVVFLGGGIAVWLAAQAGQAPPAGPGYRTYRVTGATAGSAAGFGLAVPDTWHATRQGGATVFTSPAGTTMLRVTPARFAAPRAVGEARLLEAQALARGMFPRYRRLALRPFRFRGGAGALWQFTWRPAGGPRGEVRDLLFRQLTRNGLQGYLVQESAPAASWAASQLVFTHAVQTFRPVP